MNESGQLQDSGRFGIDLFGIPSSRDGRTQGTRTQQDGSTLPRQPSGSGSIEGGLGDTGALPAAFGQATSETSGGGGGCVTDIADGKRYTIRTASQGSNETCTIDFKAEDGVTAVDIKVTVATAEYPVYI